MAAELQLDELPQDWEIAHLGDHLIRLANGLTAKQEKEPPGLAVSRIETISDGTINFEKVRYVRELEEDKQTKFLLKKGDILFSHINSDLHLGKTAIYMADKPLLHGMNLLVMRPNPETLDSKFLHYYLNLYRALGKFIEVAQHAVNQSSLNQTKVNAVPVPLPPIETQRGIVAEIEKQFSRLDEAVASLKRVKANLKRYKAAVLKAAVEGKLTEEWRKQNPDVEPGSKLLERILAERRTKWEEAELTKMKAKGKEPKNDKWKEKFVNADVKSEGLYELPTGWSWVEIGDVTDMMSGHAFKKAEYTTQGVRLFQIANVSFGSSKWDEIEHLPDEYLRSWKKLSLSEGDVVMALNRPLLSKNLKICRLSSADVPAILYQRVGKFQFFLEKVSGYFLLYMQSPIYVQQLEGQLQGVNIPFINKGKLLSTPFPLPSSVEELSEITDEADSKLSIVTELESEIEKALSRHRLLRQSVLEQAFSGKLGVGLSNAA